MVGLIARNEVCLDGFRVLVLDAGLGRLIGTMQHAGPDPRLEGAAGVPWSAQPALEMAVQNIASLLPTGSRKYPT